MHRRLLLQRAKRRPTLSVHTARRSASSSLPKGEQPAKDVSTTSSSEVAGASTSSNPYPNLMRPDPVYDPHVYHDFPADKHSPYRREVVVTNTESLYRTIMRRGVPDPPLKQREDGTYEPREPLDPKELGRGRSDEVTDYMELLPLGPSKRRNLMKFNLIRRPVTHQTGKGRIRSLYCLTVVGNGNGIVGYGEGKSVESYGKASDKAFIEAVRNLNAVERFENRTIFTEMKSKLGACQVILRPRPAGFGLMCNPHIHQVLKAAGYKDISAKVWGTRNPLTVIKTVFRMIQAGHQPLAMGDGFGGKGRKLDKGNSVITREAMERARGRKLTDLRL